MPRVQVSHVSQRVSLVSLKPVSAVQRCFVSSYIYYYYLCQRGYVIPGVWLFVASLLVSSVCLFVYVCLSIYVTRVTIQENSSPYFTR